MHIHTGVLALEPADRLGHVEISGYRKGSDAHRTAQQAFDRCHGIPGLLGYRAVNTLDAMVGHRSPRYERFGWAAARLDDLAGLGPARLTALLAVALAPAVGGSPRRALRVLRRDGGRHPSPNAGRCEAAFAGALGVRLGGTNVYAGLAEQRGLLGDGPPPGPRDIRRAVLLSRLTGAAAAGLAAAAAGALGGGDRR